MGVVEGGETMMILHMILRDNVQLAVGFVISDGILSD